MNRSNAHRHFFKAPRSIGESCNALFGWATSAGWGNCYVLSLQYLCVITFPSPSQTSRINQQTERAVRTQLGIRVDRVLKHVRAIEKSGDVPTKARTHTHITLTYTKP